MHILAEPRQEEDHSKAPELAAQRLLQWASRALTSSLGNKGIASDKKC